MGSRSQRARDVRGKLYTSDDVRFTKKGDTLHAFVLEWQADGRVTIHALGANSRTPDRGIASVAVLGVKDPLEWTRDETGLHVALSAVRTCAEAFTLKIALQ